MINKESSYAKKTARLATKLDMNTDNFQHISFKYGDDRNEDLMALSVQEWAQEFLSNLSIGGSMAVLGSYDITGTYPKYDLIIDLSDLDFQNKKRRQYHPITPHANHVKIDVDDTGNNFDVLLAELTSKQVFAKIDAALRDNQKVLINCQGGVLLSLYVI